MARARLALQEAVDEILIRHGEGGKRLSFRQAERLTGLSPATVGELAKGNARTPETIRRFAAGLGEDTDRLLMLAGFLPDDLPSPPRSLHPAPADLAPEAEVEPDARASLERIARALALLPPGPDRDLWKARLRLEAELLEAFLKRP